MSRKNRLEKDFDFLKEKYKNMFLFFLAIVTGESSLIYAVVAGEKPIYVLLIAIFGLLATVGVILKMIAIDTEVQNILDELEKLED